MMTRRPAGVPQKCVERGVWGTNMCSLDWRESFGHKKESAHACAHWHVAGSVLGKDLSRFGRIHRKYLDPQMTYNNLYNKQAFVSREGRCHEDAMYMEIHGGLCCSKSSPTTHTNTSFIHCGLFAGCCWCVAGFCRGLAGKSRVRTPAAWTAGPSESLGNPADYT